MAKITIANKKPKFQPFKVELTIETKEEALRFSSLYHKMNIGAFVTMNKRSKIDADNIVFAIAEAIHVHAQSYAR